MSATIFVSCGQQTPDERALGQEICRLIDSFPPMKAYFAENQSSVEGLTANIFEALNRASGFIAVMHRRGWVRRDLTVTEEAKPLARASVFIEQEIAIAAFLQHVMHRKLVTRSYVQTDIKREGVREFILLNPVSFEKDREVLDDLKEVLPEWASYIQQVGTTLTLETKLLGAGQVGGILQRNLKVRLSNPGVKTVKDWKVEVTMPTGVIENPSSYMKLVKSMGLAGDLLRWTSVDPPHPTWIQGGDAHDVCDLPFSVEHLESAIGKLARVRLFVEEEVMDERLIDLNRPNVV